MSTLTLLALALLVAGAVTSILPQTPGEMPLSLAGVYLYWWETGFTAPSTSVVVVLTLLGLFVIASQFIGPVIAAKVSGASTTVATVAGVVSTVLFVLWGPTVSLAGLFVTVFAFEYRRRGDLLGSLVSSVVVVLQSFGQKVVKVLVSLVILGVMVVVILL
ncbi:hypothetical protein SAMN05216226_10671 [Halovenus aranensis]|uniref:DUF456 domain-containing protein n=1 Tax=Halovenus aranensis TaxID=890420 RepID=A0A1G8VBH3_9EURY|nr:DUF456 family protein [Halovenus aranensis]SDJ62500.1 hypothetical protein SAMN05216226_10671 [Halovenus aranensis]